MQPDLQQGQWRQLTRLIEYRPWREYRGEERARLSEYRASVLGRFWWWDRRN